MFKLRNLLVEMEIVKLPTEGLLQWLQDRIDSTFIFFDTETTGLDRNKSDGTINQLTQISAIATKLNLDSFEFNEVSRFDIGIKLNEEMRNIMSNEPDAPNDDVESPEYKKWMMGTRKGILVYNHYDLVNSDSYEDERKALEMFDVFLKKHDNVILIAHNAPFDLKWIQFHELFIESTNEIIDTYDFFKNIFFPIMNELAGQQAVYQRKLDKFHSTKGNTKSVSMKHLVVGFHDDVNNLIAKSKNAHNAIVDCEMTMAVFEKGLKIVRPYLK